MPSTRKAQIEFVKQNFGTIWPAHLAAFSRLLRQLRREFDGDLDLLLVLAVIAERTPLDNWVSEVEDRQSTLISEDAVGGQAPINIKSIADYSGIPRETVRRKIGVLEGRGWVARKEDGTFAVQRRAATDLERATEHSIDYIAEILVALRHAQAAVGIQLPAKKD